MCSIFLQDGTTEQNIVIKYINCTHMPERTTVPRKPRTAASASLAAASENKKKAVVAKKPSSKPRSAQSTKPSSSPSKKKKTKPDSSSSTKKKTKRRQMGGMLTQANCSGSFNPMKTGVPAVVGGVQARGTTNAPFNSTTPHADPTPISFDTNYSIFPLTDVPPLGGPLPLQTGKGCPCLRKK